MLVGSSDLGIGGFRIMRAYIPDTRQHENLPLTVEIVRIV